MLENILFSLIGIIFGALLSWLITHIYYKKANRNNELEIENLKKYIKENANDTQKAILENSLQWETIDEWEERK